jgi:hypothetical protein
MIRCTTLVPTPTVRPIFRMPMPSARSSRMRSSTAGRTSTQPLALRPGPRRAGIEPLISNRASEEQQRSFDSTNCPRCDGGRRRSNAEWLHVAIDFAGGPTEQNRGWKSVIATAAAKVPWLPWLMLTGSPSVGPPPQLRAPRRRALPSEKPGDTDAVKWRPRRYRT